MILISIHTFLDFVASFSPYILVLIKKIYQTLQTVYDYISKHLEVPQEYFIKHSQILLLSV